MSRWHWRDGWSLWIHFLEQVARSQFSRKPLPTVDSAWFWAPWGREHRRTRKTRPRPCCRPGAQQRWASGREAELRREESRPSGKLGEAARSECLGVGERQDAICKLGPFYVASWVVGTSILRRGDAGSLLGVSAGKSTPKEPPAGPGSLEGSPGHRRWPSSKARELHSLRTL